MQTFRESVQAAVLRNLSDKQRAFFQTHPGARLVYQSPERGACHAVAIEVSGKCFWSGEGESYEDALGTALVNAMCEEYIR
jgi:hypothetical protein